MPGNMAWTASAVALIASVCYSCSASLQINRKDGSELDQEFESFQRNALKDLRRFLHGQGLPCEVQAMLLTAACVSMLLLLAGAACVNTGGVPLLASSLCMLCTMACAIFCAVRQIDCGYLLLLAHNILEIPIVWSLDALRAGFPG